MIEELKQALKRAMPSIALEIAGELKIKSPADTGRLRNSIKVISTDKGIEIFMVDYGLFVEFGTPPHVIKPKNKKALAFSAGGENVVVRSVKHPGTRPNPFIRTALKQKLPGIIARGIEREL